MLVQPSFYAPRAVLWDLDGTLANTGDLHWLAWHEVMSANGLEMSQQYFFQAFGQRNDKLLYDLLGPDLTPSTMQYLSDSKENYYRELVRRHGLELLPGVAMWLQRLRKNGWRLAVASSALRQNIETVLEVLKLGWCFDAIVAWEDVKDGKPDPQVFLLAAERVGVPPTHCIVVEDSLAGVEGAHRAGMRAIGVGPLHASLGADLALNTLEALPEDAFDLLLTHTEQGRTPG